MKRLSANELRQMWFDFWSSKNHEIIESASLIPKNDPSILFINAGVTPLKKYFDGSLVPNNRRMASSQKCIRTNDIENVGVTARHQTLFEMLGNFSVGDYFRDEAISWAFEFLTSEKWLDIPLQKLYMTVYTDDKETLEKWMSLGVPRNHIILLDSNFWEIGKGPSGPDSEIFYDRGEKYDPDGLGIKLIEDDIENDRYIEIWNNVFSQYNSIPGIDRRDYPELPSKNIDTGMGLERILTISQNVETNFDTDLFMPIIHKIEEISGKTYNHESSFKIIADHIRAITFALADGANFGNTGRDYVLRRLLRRAVRYGKKIGIDEPFMGKLIPVVVNIMEFHYPYLKNKMDMIIRKVTAEEELFNKTLVNGEKKLEEIFNTNNDHKISGEDAFKLYDTYGFPYELTVEYAKERGFSVSEEEFNEAMKKQKELARNSRSKTSAMNLQNEELINYTEKSNFIGYENLSTNTKIIGLFDGKSFVDNLVDEGYIVLENNPFYAEAGGQISDNGTILDGDINIEVVDAFKSVNKQHFLYGKWIGTIHKGDIVFASVDEEMRNKIMKNHSAAHLLQKALKEVLGEEVHQAGSRIDENNLRFDIFYEGKVSKEDLIAVEEKVNEKIKNYGETKTEILSLEDAKKTGAVALFDEKYGEEVRVVTIADSKEFCGGTHVKNVKDIVRFAIISIESKGNNVYRIEGATDTNIEKELYLAIKPYNDDMIKLLGKAKNIIQQAQKLNLNVVFDFDINNDIPHCYKDVLFNLEEVNRVKNNVLLLEKEFNEKKIENALSDLSFFENSIKEINGINTIILSVNNYEIDILKSIVDELANRINNSFIFIINIVGNKVNFITKLSNKDLNINCNKILKEILPLCDGKGGGSNVYAQGGGTLICNESKVISKVESIINEY